MTSSSAQLQRKAEQARERLSERLEDLREHLSPSIVIDDLMGAGARILKGDDIVPVLVRQAKNNPVAYALIAAGLGWLIYSETRGAPAPIAARKRHSTGKHRMRRGKAAAAQARPARRNPSR
jgi:isopentenyl phosphate kinase